MSLLKLFNLSAPRDFYLLCFRQDRPVWELCTDDGKKEIEPPGKRPRLPVLAVIPDRFFFFYQPRGLQGKSRKHLRSGAELQIRHLFPAPAPGEDVGVMDTGTDILGYFRNAGLEEFLEKQRENLALANTITTPFLLGRAVMFSRETHAWTLHYPGESRILSIHGQLEYFFGDEEELQQRAGIHGLEEEPEHVQLDDLIQDLRLGNVPWNRFRLALPELEEERGETSVLFRAAAAVLFIGLLFCGGEFVRYQSLESQRSQWANALGSLYAEALGPDYGPDPYGMLMYRADQAGSRDERGLDFVDFLGRLSRAAPEDLQVQSISLRADSGTVQATIRDYDQMERFLESLEASENYDFTLDQADSSGERVRMTLRVRY